MPSLVQIYQSLHTHRKKVCIVLLAVLCAAALYALFRPDSGKNVAYLTEPVRVGTVTRTVNASGEVKAVQIVSVGAQVSGQITKLHVHVGQNVKKGDLLAEIDSVPQLNQLETDKARLQSYQSQLTARKVALLIAQTQHKRMLQLKKNEATSRESLEDAENALALAKAQVDESQSQIRQTRIAVNTDEVNLGYTRITAPLDGTVVSVPVDEGQTVNANQTTPTIVQVADLNQMEIKIEISEGDISVVRPGMAVAYSILSDPDTQYQTTLTSIDPGLTTLTDGSYKTSASGSSVSSSSSSSSAAVYYYGNIVVNNQDGPLRIGMTIQSVITVAELTDVLLAPSVAISRTGPGKSVRVLTAGGEVQSKSVSTGLSDGANTQILSGLEAGEQVITAELTQKEMEAEMKSGHPRGPRR